MSLIRQLLLFCMSIFIYSTALSKPVKVDWEYLNFPLKVKTYRPKSIFESKIALTGITNHFNKLPVLDEVHTFNEVSKSSSATIVLVIENNQSKDVYFSAVPHTMIPQDHAFGGFFECLCNGHVYKIPAKTWWYRIIRWNSVTPLSTSKGLIIKHQIIGISEEDAKQMKSELYNEKAH